MPYDAPLAVLALAALPALLRCSPRYAVVAGGWLITTFVMLLTYSPLAETDRAAVDARQVLGRAVDAAARQREHRC